MNNLLDQSNDQFQIDPNKNYLEELVGEGKKFKDVEALARGKFLGDLHNSTLERRMDEMREDYKKVYEQSTSAPKIQDLLERLEKLELPASRTTPESNEDKTAALDTEQLELLATKKAQEVYERNETTRKQTENFNLVQNKIKEAFGDNFASALKQRADALGLSDTQVNEMARTNPNLFFKTFDIGSVKSQETFQSPPASALQGYTPPKNQKRTLSYYQDLRKKDPMLYYDPKIAVQMDKDSQALGAAFFDV